VPVNDPLPWPEPWPLPKQAGGLTGAALFALVAAASVVVGVTALLPGSVDSSAFVVVALVPLMAGLSLGSVALRLHVRTRSTAAVRSVAGALSVPFLASLWVALWLVVVGAVLLCALLCAIAELAAFATDPPDIAPLVVGILLLLLALPFLALIVDGLRGKAIRGELLVSTRGIRYRTLSYDIDIDWATVQQVSVVGGEGQRIVIVGYNNLPLSVQARSPLSRPRKAVQTQAAEATMVIRGISLSVDPALAFHTLRYYHQNPPARTELGTEAAIRRMQTGAVATT
jgi:hypothetical protein